MYSKKVLASVGRMWYSVEVVSRDIPLLQLREHISIKNVKIMKEVTR